jgi:hypothetical protein
MISRYSHYSAATAVGSCGVGDIERHLARIAESGPAAVQERLCQLDREWTSGRMTKVTVGLLIISGSALAVFVNPWFAFVPVMSGLLLAQYLFTRRDWLGMLFSSMGYRSGSAIDEERYALKVLRGDFKHLPTLQDIEDREAISRLEGEGGMVIEPDIAKLDPHEAVQQVLLATHQ